MKLNLIQSKRKYLNLGEILIVIDGLIIAVSAFTFESIEVALYSGIAVFVMTKIMDLILEGGNYAKAIIIVSEKTEEISKFITDNLGLGATLIEGKGGYSHNEKKILLCVTNKREIPKIKDGINSIDFFKDASFESFIIFKFLLEFLLGTVPNEHILSVWDTCDRT